MNLWHLFLRGLFAAIAVACSNLLGLAQQPEAKPSTLSLQVLLNEALAQNPEIRAMQRSFDAMRALPI